tara:strand:- start:567 stop:728 length:162 start_codon:yes stop_codon:yes gene_type:complete
MKVKPCRPTAINPKTRKASLFNKGNAPFKRNSVNQQAAFGGYASRHDQTSLTG